MKQLLHQFFFDTSLNDNKVLNAGWLLFRLHIGLSIAMHAGWPKMNTISAPGWFTEQVAGLGFTFPSPGFWAAMASWGEFAGGICIALGFLTRFSALQLVFQFFVIAFLWYDKPEPLTGMYFQQTLFWGFTLVMFAGGGRYSLDRLIMNRKKAKIPMPAKAAIACLLLLVTTGANAQTLSGSDFKPLEGKWTGKLTYLDYTSDTPVTIKVNAAVEMKSENQFTLSFYYTDEPAENEKNNYVINGNGTRLNDMHLIERALQTEGALKIVLERKDRDGNDHKPATIHQVIVIAEKFFTITKLVKFDGEEQFFQRHQYSFSR